LKGILRTIVRIAFTAEGKLVEEGHFIKGVKTGRWSYFFPQGDSLMVEVYQDATMLLLSHYASPGKQTVQNGSGMVEEKLENGKLFKSTGYKNGLKHGPYTEYYAGGSLRMTGTYSSGQYHGKWEYFHPYGTPMRACNYDQGKLDGKSTVFDERGRVIEESNYKLNKPDGFYISYDERTGKVRLKQICENGRVKQVLEGKPAPQK
jgi:antitoxin component YwqK of YwqJK toxin-antitoxin module